MEQTQTSHPKSDLPFSFIQEYITGKPNIIHREPYLYTLHKKKKPTYQDPSAELEGYHIKESRIFWENELKEIHLSLNHPSLILHLPVNGWNNALCRGLAKHVAHYNGLDYNYNKITIPELQGYYNNLHERKYPQNMPIFLTPHILNNQQRAEIIDRMYTAGCELLEQITTDTFQKLKPALNESRLPSICLESKALQEFADTVIANAFLTNSQPKPKVTYLTEDQRRMTSSKKIEHNDDGDC